MSVVLFAKWQYCYILNSFLVEPVLRSGKWHSLHHCIHTGHSHSDTLECQLLFYQHCCLKVHPLVLPSAYMYMAVQGLFVLSFLTMPLGFPGIAALAAHLSRGIFASCKG